MEREIVFDKFSECNTPVINIMEEGLSFLCIEEWPFEDEENYDKFAEKEILNIEQILSDIVGVEVVQEDRDRFAIMTSDFEALVKIKKYFEDKGK